MPDYNAHIEDLEEWNEDTVFLPTVTTMHMTELGVMVVQDVDQCTRQYDGYGVYQGLGKPTKIQLVAVYGDRDRLVRLVVFDNGKKPNEMRNTQTLINDAPIRG